MRRSRSKGVCSAIDEFLTTTSAAESRPHDRLAFSIRIHCFSIARSIGGFHSPLLPEITNRYLIGKLQIQGSTFTLLSRKFLI